MNIFAVDKDPVVAAKALCDQHIVKMPIETAQLLCSVFQTRGLWAPYGLFNPKHPAARWTANSRENYNWLLRHGKALCEEYTRRYARQHASEEVIDFCHRHADALSFSQKKQTPFAQCMPKNYRISGDSVEAYRHYYQGEKLKFARWRHSQPPIWLKEN